jgi:glycosyltransferase involved in cell wall biosynthesis
MRILMLTSIYEPVTGGAETYMRLLAEGLVERGHEVVVATDGTWVPDLPRDRVEPSGRVLRPREFDGRLGDRTKPKWRQLQYAVLEELGELLAGETFDVVHANSHDTLILATIIALDLGAALVGTLQEVTPHQEAFGLGHCRLSFQALPVDLYLAPSRFYAQRAAEYGVPADRLRFVYYGVRDEPAAPGDREAARAALGLTDEHRLILCPARVYARKAQLDLAAALPAIAARHPEVRVLLAGRVSNVAYAQRMWQVLDELGVAHLVTHRQDYYAGDMPSVYAAADLVVLPSLAEGLGLAAVEAMLAGRPIVVTDVAGLNEVVTDGHDGLLVPPAAPDRLAAALLRLLDDPPLAQRLADRGRATAAERFGLDRMVAETLTAYEDALARRAATADPALVATAPGR